MSTDLNQADVQTPRVLHRKPLKNKLSHPTDENLFDSIQRVFDLMSIFPQDTLQVDVKDGWITLTGTVDWQFQHDATVAAIRHLKGVLGLIDHIHVMPARIHLEKITN